MKWIQWVTTVGLSVIGFSGCQTLENRAEKIRAEEKVLFEGVAKTGLVSNSGDAIYWDQTASVPVTATPTTLYYGLSSKAYTWIDSVEVASFTATKQLFIKETTYNDLLVFNEGFNQKRVFLFLPENRKRDVCQDRILAELEQAMILGAEELHRLINKR